MPVVGGIVADRFGLPVALGLAVLMQILLGLLVLGVRETAPRVVGRRAVGWRSRAVTSRTCIRMQRAR
jgi:hypothetical protein